MNDDQKIIVDRALQLIQDEWEENRSVHEERNLIRFGIRSSQISALVAFLVKIGVIKAEDVSENI